MTIEKPLLQAYVLSFVCPRRTLWHLIAGTAIHSIETLANDFQGFAWSARIAVLSKAVVLMPTLGIGFGNEQ